MTTVSVLLPVYNGDKFLSEAINSILNQTFEDFELLIINDCSKDRSEEIVLSFKDSRIRYIKNESNLGLAATLNYGIRFSKGEFIARMDQDDIAEPSRLAKQLVAFEEDADLTVCGTQFTMFGAVDKTTSSYPTEPENIRASLLFYNCVAHPTVMIRKKVLLENDLFYDSNYDWAEDFELWNRASKKVKFRNLPESLLNYRINEDSMTGSSSDKVQSSIKKIYTRDLKELGISPVEELLDLHMRIGNRMLPKDTKTLGMVEKHLLSIIDANNRLDVFNNSPLRNVVTNFWLHYGEGKSLSNFLARPLSQKLGITKNQFELTAFKPSFPSRLLNRIKQLIK